MKSRARIMLESLTGEQILRHKKEKSFYVEKGGDYFIINRNGKVKIVNVETAEKIIKHHDTRNWQVKEAIF